MIVHPYETGIVHANSLDHLLREVENFWMHEPPKTAMWHPGNRGAVTGNDYPVVFTPQSVERRYPSKQRYIGQGRNGAFETMNLSDFPTNLEFVHYLRELEKKGALHEVWNHPTPLIASVMGLNSKYDHMFEVDFYDVGALKNMFFSRFGNMPYVPQGYPQPGYQPQGYPGQAYPPLANQGVSGLLGSLLGQIMPGYGKPEFEYALLQNDLIREDLTYQEYHMQTYRDIKLFFSMMDRL